MELERTTLAGIGLLRTFATSRGRRVGVIALHTGERSLVLYDEDDPDTVADRVQLTMSESDTLADLLSASQIVERLADLEQQVQGLVTRQICIEPGSVYDRHTLGDTQARTRTGASIVAVVRDGNVIASPRPDFVFQANDTVVAVGTAEGTDAVAALLTDG